VRFTAKRVGMDGHVGTAQHSYADDETMQPCGTFEVRNTGQIDTPILNVESDVALNGGCAAATYYPPEQGGDFLIGYTFPDDVMTPETQRERIAGEEKAVRVEGLQVLSDGDTTWLTLSGVTPWHGANHFGSSTLVAAVHNLAMFYNGYHNEQTGIDTRGERLKINDMSLGYGGMFEICGTWNWRDHPCPQVGPEGGHRFHRDGMAADISQRTALGSQVNESVIEWGEVAVESDLLITKAHCNWHGTGDGYHCHFEVQP